MQLSKEKEVLKQIQEWICFSELYVNFGQAGHRYEASEWKTARKPFKLKTVTLVTSKRQSAWYKNYNNLFTQPPQGVQAGSAHTAKGAGMILVDNAWYWVHTGLLCSSAAVPNRWWVVALALTYWEKLLWLPVAIRHQLELIHFLLF